MKIPERVRNLEKKPAPILTESFGPLQGIRVLSTGNLIAAPFAGSMFADFGAEVIHIENPGVGDPLRQMPPFIEKDGEKVSAVWLDNGRNRLSMELDLRININPLSQEVFLNLIKVCDIWIDNLAFPDQLSDITDKFIHEVNPQITIVHESGYGNPDFGGIPKVCLQPSSDLTGQAYGGWSYLVGDPEGPPTRIPAGVVDYITALNVFFSGLVGYIDTQRRQKGQVFDCAQYEVIARILGENFSNYFNLGIINKRQGNKSAVTQPYNFFKASDGYIALGAYGFSVYGRYLKAMAEATGLNPADYPMDEAANGSEALNSPKGKNLDRITEEWIARHTREEVASLFEKYEVPCGPVYNAEDASADPHWLERDDFITFMDEELQKEVKSFGFAPKFSLNPGRVWRGAPRLGQDTNDILLKILGYTPEEVQMLWKEKIVCL